MIEKGRPWGRLIERPDHLEVVASDADLGTIISGVLDGDIPARPVTIRHGDLARTLGTVMSSTTDSPEPSLVRSVDLDAVRFRTDRHAGWAVSHLVVRRPRSRGLWGPIVAIMNAEYLGGLDLAPRGHPNDGRVEVVEVAPSMTVRQRLEARRRLPRGSHLPHPAISTGSMSAGRWDVDGPAGLWVDGRPIGRISYLEISVLADAYEMIIA